MKRLLALSAKTVVWALVLLVSLCLLADAICEIHGVPGWAANTVCALLAERGISLQTDSIRAGVVRGVALDHARLRLSWQGMPLTITCREIRARPSVRDLLLGRVEAQTVTFDDASAALAFGPLPPPGSARPALRIERCSGEAHRRRDGVVDLTVEGLAEKIAVHLDAELRGLAGVSVADRGTAGSRPPATASGPASATAAAHLQRLSDLLHTCRLAERDAFLSGRLTLDLARPRDVAFDGEVGVSELLLGELLISRLKSSVHYRAPEIRLETLTLILGEGQKIAADIAIDLAAATVRGKLQGQVLPETLRRLRRGEGLAWLERVQSTVPLDATVELQPSPWPPSRWRFTAAVTSRRLELPGLTINRLDAAAAWDGEALTVSHWHARLDSAGVELAEGRLVWHRADATLEGELSGRCQLGDRIRQVGNPALATALRRIEFAAPVTVQASLARSPLDWRRLRAQATLATDTVRVHGRVLAPVTAAAELRDAMLSLDALTVGLPDGPADTLVLAATVPLAAALDSGSWEIRTQVCCKAIMDPPAGPAAADRPAPAWREAVALSGGVLYTPESGALDVTAEGTAYPGRWYATFVPRLGLPDSGILRDIRCAPEAPARVLLTAARPDQRQPFRLQATVAAEGTRYADLVFREIQGDIELTPTCLSFANIAATTTTGAALGLDLRIDFEPLAVTIRNGRVIGNPEVVSTFIEDRDAKAIYRRVWEGFRWNADRPAAIDLRELAYRETPGGRTWRLTMDASLQAEQATYRDLPVKRLDATVCLDLPERVEVRSARLESDTALDEGEITILTGADPKCTFEVRHVRGGQDPARVLRLLNPDWGSALGPLAFSPDSAVDCRGSFYLSREPLLQVSGTLRAPYADFRGLRVEAPDVQWRLSQSEVHWNLMSGRLFGGPVAMTGVYDVDTGQGDLAFRGEGMGLKALAEHFGMASADGSGAGLVEAHCNLQVLRGWAGRDLQVYGDGFFGIREADLWRVPLFDPLGRLLDVSFLNRLTGGKASGLGRLTRLDADLGFTGDRVAIRSMSTDGTILSLRGRGEYCWETDRIGLSVTGQTLDSAGIVGWIFKPLSWAFFNAELSGTAKDHKWRLSTAFSKALPGGSGGGDDVVPMLPPEP